MNLIISFRGNLCGKFFSTKFFKQIYFLFIVFYSRDLSNAFSPYFLNLYFIEIDWTIFFFFDLKKCYHIFHLFLFLNSKFFFFLFEFRYREYTRILQSEIRLALLWQKSYRLMKYLQQSIGIVMVFQHQICWSAFVHGKNTIIPMSHPQNITMQLYF